MIITVLKGGLGNQLFQYAFARSLSIKTGSNLFFDISWFDSPVSIIPGAVRRLVLEEFQVNGKYLPNTFSRIITGIAQFLRNRSFLNTITAKYVLFIDQENVFNYLYNSHKELSSFALVEGYWQSEDFFKENKEVIRRELTLNYTLNPKDRELVKELSSLDSVSLHIRRGDYANNQKTNQRHGVLDLEYYQTAVAKITKQINPSTIFVFTDDIPWCRENLVLGQPWYMLSNGARKASSELHLMACCRHHIIANSSFSWWGAWLGEQDGSITIAPKKWFNSGLELFNIVPARWIRL